MVASTLEKPQEKISFSGDLTQLKEELKKHQDAQNRDRLDEFQKTIDEELKKGEKTGLIEFTENEWHDLITKENLPPIEVVKKLLKEKIEGMKLATEAAKEGQHGFMSEIQKKTEEVKKTVTDKVEEVKDKATSAIKEALSPLEKIKNGFSKIGTSISEIWSNLWTPVKFAWYTLWATLGFKFGKDALAAMTKEKAEKVVEAAKEKAAELGKGEEKAAEGKEGMGEKVGPLAALGIAGGGIFALIKSKLPKSVVDKIGDEKGTGLLKKLAGNRALRLFGIGGVTLFGIGKLSEYIEKNGAELGEMPSDEAGKKVWWEKAIEKMKDLGNETKDALKKHLCTGKDVVTGDMLSEYLEKNAKEPAEGMVTLREKMEPTADYLDDLEFDIEKYWDKIMPLIASLMIANPQMRSLAIGSGKNTLKISGMITGLIGRNLLGTLFIFSAIKNGTVLAGHSIHVPEDNNDLADWFRDIIQLPEIREEFEKKGLPTEALDHARENIDEIVDLMTDEGKRQQRLDAEKEKVMEKITSAGVSFVAPEKKDVIHKATKEGCAWFRKNLERHMKNPSEREKEFIKKLEEIEKKVLSNVEITREDIAGLMTASHGTNIRINDKWNGYIRWSINDDMGVVKSADFLCASPLLDDNERYHKSRKMSVNKEGVLGLLGTIPGAFLGGLQGELTELRDAIEKNDTKKGGSILEKMLGNKWEVVAQGGKVMWEGLTLPLDFWKNAIKTFSGEMTAQEMLVETTDGLAPVIVMCSGAAVGSILIHKLSGGRLGKKSGILGVLISSASYLVGKGQYNLGRDLYYAIVGSKHSAQTFMELLADRKFTIQSGFYEFIDRKRSLKYRLGGVFSNRMKELGKIFKELADVQRIGRNLELAKRARARGNIRAMDQLIDEARTLAGDILRDHQKLHGHTPHALHRVAGLNASNLDTIIGELQHDVNNLYQRRSVAQSAASAHVQSQAQHAVNTPPNSPQRSRLKKATGLAGLVALLAAPVIAGAVADKKSNKEAANEEDELGESYEPVEYGGFGAEGKESGKVDNHSLAMAPIFSEIDTIKDDLLGNKDVEKTKSLLTNSTEFFLQTNEGDMKALLTDVKPRYMASVNRFRKTCQQNKEAIKKYFLDNPDKQNKEIKVCEFLGITWKEGELNLRYMSEEKFERHFYSTFDHVKNNQGDYEDDGHQSGWEKTGEVAKNMAPVVSSWIDTKQAWKDFSRGHVKSGLINGSMAALGWTSDILMGLGIASAIVSGPVGPAVGVGGGAALRGGILAIRGSKVVKGIIASEQIAEAGTQTIQGVNLAIEKDVTEAL